MTVAKEPARLPAFFTNCDCMMLPICWGPSNGRRAGSRRTVEADSEAGDLPVLIVELLGLVMLKGFLVLESSSRPAFAGAAFLPILAGGASLERLCWTTGVADVSYLPAFADGGSCLALPAEDRRTRDVVEGVVFDDILVKQSKLRVGDKGA